MDASRSQRKDVVERGASTRGPGRVLVVGVYLADHENTAEHVATELGRSSRWSVEQRWVALGRSPPPPALAGLTVRQLTARTPKFSLVNEVLRASELAAYEYILVTDDDIELPGGFLDGYLERVGRHELALAQPARTHDSYIDHALVEQLDGLDARWTRFVEIGPLFSVHRTAVPLLLPFDEDSPMGWGYDYVWPVVLEQAGLRLGIVDALPIAHRMRKPVANYDYTSADRTQQAFLAKRPHLTKAEAYSIVEAYL
jgi:hypothetical protein